MTVSINASANGTFGELQVNGVPKLRFGSDTSGQVPMFRNRIINGDMRIDQRFGGATQTPAASAYIVDRWNAQMSQASKYQVGQNLGAFATPDGFTNYLGMKTVSAFVVGAADFFSSSQTIEGFNVADLGFGTAAAKTITLSFLVHTSITGTHSGSLRNGTFNRSYPFSFTVPVANTWTPISITIPGDTTGTWATNNTAGIIVNFSLGIGTTFSSTAGTWQAGNFTAVTGAVRIVETLNATFNVTGVQVELGSIATLFERRNYITELTWCRRYFNRLINTNCFWSGNTTSGSQYYVHYYCPVQMRTAPSFVNVVSFAASGFPTTPTSGISHPDFVQFTNTANATVSGGFFYVGADLNAEL